MDDMNDDGMPEAEHRVAMTRVYMESLRARMDPARYDSLTRVLHEYWHMIENGSGEGHFSLEDDGFTEDVQKEFAIILAIVGTGRMDYRTVDMPGTDGSRGWAIVTDEVADDPGRLADLTARMKSWRQDQEATAETLAGIEKASQKPPGN